jgi:hypothetical protein
MRQPILSALLLGVACLASLGAPLAAGELIIPLTAGVAPDGTAYVTRVWITNTGTVERRWTSAFVAPGSDGTKAPSQAITVAPGSTVLATNLAPAGQSGLLFVSGAPQLLTTARQEAVKNGALRAASAGPLVTGHELAPARGSLHLHGLSNKQGGLITDLSLVNAARQSTQCTVDAFRDNGSRIGAAIRLTLPPLSARVFEKALTAFGATDIDEARLAVSCDQPFYTYARVYKPSSGELNVVTPSQALGG